MIKKIDTCYRLTTTDTASEPGKVKRSHRLTCGMNMGCDIRELRRHREASGGPLWTGVGSFSSNG
jgi:hypothetical protein